VHFPVKQGEPGPLCRVMNLPESGSGGERVGRELLANVTVTDLEELQELLMVNIENNKHLVTGCNRISASPRLHTNGRLHLL
uniref:Uncharacterized protein n=1 Tax=Athene cunicularia TaxID=194338 RepID=A0A663LPX5_ATHCN